MDWYSRYVLAWRLSNTLEVDFCVEALESALGKANPEIFNTDQGSQFTSEAFTGILLEQGIQISMDGKGLYTVLATSKSGTLLLRRDQGDVAALLDSLSRWL